MLFFVNEIKNRFAEGYPVINKNDRSKRAVNVNGVYFIIGEEIGFIGLIALMFVYVLLIWRGCKAAMNAPDFYGMMLASGISIMIGVQVCINIAVVTSSMPPTGVILPFVSYGGNALMLLMGLMGILWNVTKQSEKKEIRLLAEQEKRALEEERQRMIRRTVRQR